jgi:hypothetical protein
LFAPIVLAFNRCFARSPLPAPAHSFLPHRVVSYALFGVALFAENGEDYRFGSLTNALITLFAVLNGDVVRDTFMAGKPFHPILSQIYMYTFVCASAR